MNIEAMVATISVVGLIAAAIIGYQGKEADKEAAKAGLQQCVVEHIAVWQKECAK